MQDPKDRITVVQHIYHQSTGEQPTQIDNNFTRNLETIDQPYVRRCKATETKQKLDCGWLQDVSRIIIINEEGTNLQVVPTDGERKATAAKILELSFQENGPGWLILPGESFHGSPSDVSNLLIRSLSGITKYTLHALPR